MQNKINSLEESMEMLDKLSDLFVIFLNNLIEIMETNTVNLIGVGNSISSGWTAIDNNVQSWLEKLHPFLDSKAKNGGLGYDGKMEYRIKGIK